MDTLSNLSSRVAINQNGTLPASYPAGTVLTVGTGVTVTTSNTTFGDNCTLILNQTASLMVGSTGTSTLKFGKNCRIILEANSKLSSTTGSTISVGEYSTLDARQGTIEFTGQIQPGAKLLLAAGTILMLSPSHPATGTGTIAAPAFAPTVSLQKYATIDAPLGQIFDGVSITGNWQMDRAYPQWFAPANCDDWADPINKAIEMKRTGEVFLPRGIYPIKSSIKVNTGICLTGETGVRGYDYEKYEYLDNHGTTIAAVKSSNTDDPWQNFMLGCMILVNISTSKIDEWSKDKKEISKMNTQGAWDNAYPSMSTIVSNITLNNGTNVWQPAIFKLCGIFFAGTISLKQVFFGNFKQALVRSSDYSDSTSINRCSFSEPDPQHFTSTTITSSESTVYLPGNGDNLIFESNAFNSGCDKNTGLYLRGCNGGSIRDNVINRDVEINNCRAVSFVNNHMEDTFKDSKAENKTDKVIVRGPQVRIINSQVSISNNFFYKSEKPNIIIRGSNIGEPCVVELINNTFLCYFGIKGKGMSPSKITSLIDYWKEMMGKPEVLLDIYSTVKISDQYRQIVGRNSLTWMSQVGIQFGLAETGKTESSNDSRYKVRSEQLNYLSPFLSIGGCITPGFKISGMSNQQKDINKHALSIIGENDNNRWFAETGKYEYFCQIVYDMARHVIAQAPSGYRYSLADSQGNKVFNHKNFSEALEKNDESASKGAIIRLASGLGYPAFCGYVRVFRKKTIGSTVSWEKAEVPVCGAPMLYDNGISLSGYLWEESSASEASGFRVEFLLRA